MPDFDGTSAFPRSGGLNGLQRRWLHNVRPTAFRPCPNDDGPHRFETAVLLVFFAVLLIPCFVFRIRLWSAALVCALGYALLAIAPVSRGLLAFDYDTFHLGVALDSIALSICPMGWGYSDAHTVFTLGFLAIVFTIFRIFLASPLARPNDSTTSPVA